MVTNTNTTHLLGRAITTYITGTVGLSYFDVQGAPDDIEHRACLNPIECVYYARIEWADRKVIVTIGDYIIAEWIIGDKTPVKFTNDKGYGDKHEHSYVRYLPTDIVSDVMGHLWPAM